MNYKGVFHVKQKKVVIAILINLRLLRHTCQEFQIVLWNSIITLRSFTHNVVNLLYNKKFLKQKTFSIKI